MPLFASCAAVTKLQQQVAALIEAGGQEYFAGDGLQLTTATFSVDSSVARTSGSLAQFSSTTSAQLRTLLSDETGTGSAVFNQSPTILTPRIASLYDSLGLVWLTSIPAAAAVNTVGVESGATGQPIKIRALGGDTNVDIWLDGVGTGSSVMHKAIITAATIKMHADAYVLVTGSRSLTDADNGKVLYNNAAATLTVPNTLTLPFSCVIEQRVAGQITVAAGAGFTLRNIDTHTKTAGQWASATIEVIAGTTDVVLMGRTAA